MYITPLYSFLRITISLAVITKSSVFLCQSLTDPKMRSNVFLLILGLMLLMSVSRGYIVEKKEGPAVVSDEASDDELGDIAREKRSAGNSFDKAKNKKRWWWPSLIRGHWCKEAKELRKRRVDVSAWERMLPVSA
ncbi:hypothetical protein LSAT2_013506 [Lamellibrachia satsuma]|nr:hypothetical protein LSAT2_013506 [Lamellibrachia satsuma]